MRSAKLTPLARIVRQLHETYDLPIPDRLATVVFGLMIGRMPHRVEPKVRL